MIDIAIVLVEPARGGNVGASARAMKTMGFTDLRVVVPPEHCQEPLRSSVRTSEAKSFAHGSTDILDSARLFPSLEEALTDRDLVVGTTARRRGNRDDYYPPAELREMLSEGKRGERIALVFGREESGLSNRELSCCHVTTAIPMRASYPSLNLSQAVMVYCYELSPLCFQVHQPRQDADQPTLDALSRKAASTLWRLGFDPGRAVSRRIMERLGALQRIDTHLALSVINAIDQRLPGADHRCGEGLPVEDDLPGE
ncbi:tRNA/rRNA methyltransferase [Alkalispirochaeta americana]|uniref:tRNA (cytidine/uridine-2'-O-)-methyltransferase TrmJ n=1 Tax=Alkalispirochaeta americana TaxID=159291 RepID=A0A1N6PC26_9SPIO|nr:tRNA/rRNA methyltransferase [Alkalispirochaeta americana]SIQ01827.1 tRNA/rRNA methyltransferase [Alkalispirochaeta americana]